jgi:1,4-alpha-glucan branching enzyme
MIHKRPSTNQGKVIVTFEIPGTIWAERINLVGDFNDWDRESLPFRHNRQENWQIEIELDAGREYHFRYLFDGDRWHDDWHADRCTTDPHGGCHSIVIARIPPETQDVESWGEGAVLSDVVPLGAPSGHWESTRQIQNVV